MKYIFSIQDVITNFLVKEPQAYFNIKSRQLLVVCAGAMIVQCMIFLYDKFSSIAFTSQCQIKRVIFKSFPHPPPPHLLDQNREREGMIHILSMTRGLFVTYTLTYLDQLNIWILCILFSDQRMLKVMLYMYAC